VKNVEHNGSAHLPRWSVEGVDFADGVQWHNCKPFCVLALWLVWLTHIILWHTCLPVQHCTDPAPPQCSQHQACHQCSCGTAAFADLSPESRHLNVTSCRKRSRSLCRTWRMRFPSLNTHKSAWGWLKNQAPRSGGQTVNAIINCVLDSCDLLSPEEREEVGRSPRLFLPWQNFASVLLVHQGLTFWGTSIMPLCWTMI